MPGPACKCARGFAGEPEYTPPQVSQDSRARAYFSSETCTDAECKIPNSEYSGIYCKCKDMFVGHISWEGPVAHGECKPAPCDVPNSNKKPGPDCRCLYGFSGDFYMRNWGTKVEGHCIALSCEGKFSNQKYGPNCACADGYNGTVVQYANWHTHEGALVADNCLPAACDVDGSIGDGLECRCRDGFQGQITWEGPRAMGSCRPAPCSVANSNRKTGTDCKCLDGYDGSNLDFDVVAICLRSEAIGGHKREQPPAKVSVKKDTKR